MRSVLRPAAILLLAAGPAFGQETPAAPVNPDAPAAATGAAAAGTPGTITLELNKLAASENVCQAYFVVDNQSPHRLQELKVDVYLFDKQDVVLRGVALPFADVRAGRTMVVPFELPDLPCGDIGRVLLNKVLVCTDASGAPVEACADMLAVNTRSDVAFEY